MPKIPQVIAGPTQLGGPARPEDAGSGLGTEALAQASKETAQVTEALFNEFPVLSTGRCIRIS